MTTPNNAQLHLQNATPPWSSLLVVPQSMAVTRLLKAPTGFALRTIEGKKCRTTSSLFDEFAKALDLPEYFGHNWDALEECLADFEWLPAQGYVLLITDAQAVLSDDDSDEYTTLLEILNDAGEAWSNGQTASGRSRPFHVFFIVTEQEKAKRTQWRLKELPLASEATRPTLKTAKNPSHTKARRRNPAKKTKAGRSKKK